MMKVVAAFLIRDHMLKLTEGQILRLVDYIGVCNGYLGQPETLRFTYRSHKEFYPIYCDLDLIDPTSMQGTTRERFIAILRSAEPKDQAKIIRGIFKKFTPDCTIEEGCSMSYNGTLTHSGIELSERENIKNEYLKLAEKLENDPFNVISNITDSKTALKALGDAQILLKERGAQSAIDRVHTVLHAFLISICEKNNFFFEPDDSITELFKVIKDSTTPSTNQKNLVEKIERLIATFIDSLNPIRNRQSLAHANNDLICDDDAQFIIDVVVASIRYIAKKITKNNVKLSKQ